MNCKKSGISVDKIAVILTDGNGGYIDEAQNYIDHGWRIFTIGLGSSVDTNLLENEIANLSGGKFFSISTEEAAQNAIQEIYQEIRQIVSGEQTLLSEELLIQQDEVIEREIFIPEKTKNATFSRVIEGSDVEMILIKPDGSIVDRTVVGDPNVYHALGFTYEIYKISNPQSDIWTVRLIGTDAHAGGEVTNLKITSTSSMELSPPIYNATGTWKIENITNWSDNNPVGCTPYVPQMDSFTIYQSGNSFTWEDESCDSHTGSVDGQLYSISWSELGNGGTFEQTTSSILTGSEVGTGAREWNWTDDADNSFTCSGGWDFTFSKEILPIPISQPLDEGGGGGGG